MKSLPVGRSYLASADCNASRGNRTLPELDAVQKQWPFYLPMRVMVLYGEQDCWPGHHPLLALAELDTNR